MLHAPIGSGGARNGKSAMRAAARVGRRRRERAASPGRRCRARRGRPRSAPARWRAQQRRIARGERAADRAAVVQHRREGRRHRTVKEKAGEAKARPGGERGLGAFEAAMVGIDQRSQAKLAGKRPRWRRDRWRVIVAAGPRHAGLDIEQVIASSRRAGWRKARRARDAVPDDRASSAAHQIS